MRCWITWWTFLAQKKEEASNDRCRWCFFSDGVEFGGVTRDMLMGSSQHTRRRLTSSTITKTGARTMIYMHFLTIREIVLCWFGTAICVSGETESIFSFNHCQPFVRSNWSLARLQLKKSPCQTVFSVRLLRIPAFNPPHVYSSFMTDPVNQNTRHRTHTRKKCPFRQLLASSLVVCSFLSRHRYTARNICICFYYSSPTLWLKDVPPQMYQKHHSNIAPF